MAVFVTLHAGLIDPNWFAPGVLNDVATWLEIEGPNPYSCAAIGELTSVGLTWLVSRLTQPLPDAHIEELFSTT